MSELIITGDIHALWGQLNSLINKKRPKYVICCGDFGFWPGKTETIYLGFNKVKRIELWPKGHIKNKDTKVFFCDGNHEDHWELEKLIKDKDRFKPVEIEPNVFYCPRGTIINIQGLNILFFGGALSIDKHYRTLGIDWFPEEVPSYKDVRKILNHIENFLSSKNKIDIVISHTCPKKFDFPKEKSLYDEERLKDATRDYLDCILELTKPDFWFFGHFHIFDSGVYKNTKWIALNMAPETGWWTKLSCFLQK